MSIEDELSGIHFDATRNAIYHTARRLFLDKWNRRLNLVVILAGAGVMSQIGKGFGVGDVAFGFIATLAGSLQLVFDLGVKARDHEFLQRRYYELLAEVTERIGPEPSDVAKWKAQLQRLAAEEPPPMRALDAIAYNAACDSLGKDHGRVRVTFWQSLWRHLYPFNGTSFPYVAAHVDGATS